MSETLSERDLRALMSIIQDGRRDAPTAGLPWVVLEGLAGLVKCDNVSFPEADLVNARNLLDQWVEDGQRGLILGDGDTPPPAIFWEYLRQFLPCSYPHRTGDLLSVVRWSDFYTPAQLRNAPWFAEFIGAHGTRYGLHASFPTVPGQFRKLTFWRSTGPDFTERDRLIIELLRPHIYELYLNSQRRRPNVPRLTPREWEVLHLTQDGYSNSEIAHQLFISTATVRKH